MKSSRLNRMSEASNAIKNRLYVTKNRWSSNAFLTKLNSLSDESEFAYGQRGTERF